jgi:hypothetical protein
MSTSTEENKVVVTLHKGVDVDAFIDEMNSIGHASPYVPNRQIEIYNLKPESLRNVDFVMSREEMELLKQDPRVLDCRWGTKKENGIEAKPNVLDSSRTYTRTTTFGSGNLDCNWGLVESTNRTKQFTSSDTLNYSLPYTLSGRGVDFVIQDSGLQVDHPEFQDENGVNRVNQIDWFAATGQSGTMPSNFYTDEDGHGTNVCGIAASKTYGWARNSQIYVMNILGINANSTISPSLSFNLLRLWHQEKPITSTGYKRPTVVNMSWGYGYNFSTLSFYTTGGSYRGTPWSGTSLPQNAYGLINPTSGTIPATVASDEADMEDALDAGIILVGAAGNDAYKMDVPGGLDYNNFLNTAFGTIYYHRGGTPSVYPRVTTVGCIDLQYTTERKANFSNCGPRVDVFAPGSRIPAPVSNITSLGGYPIVTYPYNSSYKVGKVSGTSQASPQVAGLACCLLEARPYMNSEDVRLWMIENSTINRLTSTGTLYTDLYNLQSAGNRYLYNPFTGTQVTNMSGGDSQLYGSI